MSWKFQTTRLQSGKEITDSINLYIYNIGGEFQISCRAIISEIGERELAPQKLMLTPEEIDNKISGITDVLLSAAKKDKYNSVLFLIKISSFGEDLFESVFSQETKNYFREIFLSNSSDHPPNLEIYSEYSILPWEMLYISNSIGGGIFLGFSSIIYRSVPNNNYPRPAINGEINIVSAYDYDYNKDIGQGIRYTKIFEDRFFHKGRAKIPGTTKTIEEISHCEGKAKKEITRELFEKIIEYKPTIIHFACHGKPGNSYYDETIVIRNKFGIEYKNICNLDIVFESNPIMFMNACNCDLPRPKRLQTMGKLLCKEKKIRAFIAPQFHVGDKQSARFALRFYRNLLKKKCTAANALYIARREMLDKEGSLVGLLYSMLGQGRSHLI